MSGKTNEVLADVNSVYRWEMESNPTTGYGWYLVSDEGLKIESEFISKSDLCGAPGIQTFKVSSSIPGEFRITAEYLRPWENCEPLESKRLFITFV